MRLSIKMHDENLALTNIPPSGCQNRGGSHQSIIHPVPGTILCLSSGQIVDSSCQAALWTSGYSEGHFGPTLQFSVVLHWLCTPARLLKIFVTNWITFITDVTNPLSWFHVPGLHNPADLASRGLLPYELSSCCLWCSSPEWLVD